MSFDYAEYLEQEKNYLQENASVFSYYNPHPKEIKTTDCVVRAVTCATNGDYIEARKSLNAKTRIMKQRKRKRPITSYKDDRVCVAYIEQDLQGTKLEGYKGMKIGDFAKLNLDGTYIISCKRHLVAVKSGLVMDTWNSSFKAIGKIWRIK